MTILVMAPAVDLMGRSDHFALVLVSRTYSIPRRKTAIRPILRLVDILRFQIKGIGMAKMNMSTNTSVTANPNSSHAVLEQSYLEVY